LTTCGNPMLKDGMEKVPHLSSDVKVSTMFKAYLLRLFVPSMSRDTVW
jgi:hypothetical protein